MSDDELPDQDEAYAERLAMGFHLLSDDLNSEDDDVCIFYPWEPLNYEWESLEDPD